MKILLLDDHALFRAGLRLLLKTLDPATLISEAGSIAEALQVVEQEADLNLCLLDLQLRSEKGLDVISRIKAAAPECSVVMVSAAEDPATMRACIDAGAMSFITKSSTPEALAEALKYVLAGTVYLPAVLLNDDWQSGETAPGLSPRQHDVLRGLCRGLSTKAIARELALSDHTVKDYIAALYKLLDVHNRTEAVIKTGRLRLLPDQSQAPPS